MREFPVCMICLSFQVVSLHGPFAAVASMLTVVAPASQETIRGFPVIVEYAKRIH